jgi:hypothetical protein
LNHREGQAYQHRKEGGCCCFECVELHCCVLRKRGRTEPAHWRKRNEGNLKQNKRKNEKKITGVKQIRGKYFDRGRTDFKEEGEKNELLGKKGKRPSCDQ